MRRPEAPDAAPTALSVVIPARDRPVALAALLEAFARDADGAPVEIVVVDDASDPPAVAPPPVRLLRLPVRAGANAARLAGLALARGAHVHFHDSDDGIEPGWTAAVLRAIADRPDADVLVTRRIDEIDGARRPARQAFFERCAARPRRIRRALALRNVLGPFGGVVFRRRALAAATFPAMASSQDWAVYREVYRAAPMGAAVPDARFVYRRDGADRISASPRRKALGMFALLRAWRGGRFETLMRLHHLHLFRRWLRAARRRRLDALMDRTRVSRRLVFAVCGLYLTVCLGRR